jgi:hypothetical protein
MSGSGVGVAVGGSGVGLGRGVFVGMAIRPLVGVGVICSARTLSTSFDARLIKLRQIIKALHNKMMRTCLMAAHFLPKSLKELIRCFCLPLKIPQKAIFGDAGALPTHRLR